MDTPEGIAAIDVFYRIAFEEKPRYQHQGWLSRRMTTDDNFTYYRVPYPSWKTTCRLFQRGISYVIVGKEYLDYTLLMEKLSTQFGIKVLMLDGGGILNWSFIGAGLCDELSVVIAAAADGFSDPPALFETR